MADDTKNNKEAPAWFRLHLWQMQPIRDVLLGLSCLALFWLAQATSVVTVPLLLAILLAYLFEPVIQFAIRRLNMSRQGAVVGIIAALAIVVIVPASLAITYGTVQVVSLTGNVIQSYDEMTDARGRAKPYQEGLAQRRAARALATEAASQDAEDQETPPAKPDTDQAQADPGDSTGGEGTPETGTVVVTAAQDPEDIKAREELVRIRAELDENTGWLWALIYDQIQAEQFGGDGSGTDIGGAIESVIGFIESNSDDIAKTSAGFAMSTVERVLGFALTLFSLAFMGFITAFFFFFLATGWVQFKGFTGKLMPDKHRDRITDLAIKFDAVISGFIRGRITIAFIQSIVFSIGYLLIGVPAAFILGPIVAILSIVPYLALVGLPVAVGLMFVDSPDGFRGEWWWIVGAPTVFYFLGQSLDDYVWTPMIQGKSTGLDTPVILFASMAGGALFGVFGLLIAIPLAACAKILIQEIFWPRFKDWAEGRTADPLPIDQA